MEGVENKAHRFRNTDFQNALAFTKVKAREVMVRAEVVALEKKKV